MNNTTTTATLETLTEKFLDCFRFSNLTCNNEELLRSLAAETAATALKALEAHEADKADK
jgi:hypothetical protein